jgi:hypothetical protein
MRLADRLTTPLQIEHYLTRALEVGHKIGQKPLSSECIESMLAQDLDDLEPRLTAMAITPKPWPTCGRRPQGKMWTDAVPEVPITPWATRPLASTNRIWMGSR